MSYYTRYLPICILCVVLFLVAEAGCGGQSGSVGLGERTAGSQQPGIKNSIPRAFKTQVPATPAVPSYAIVPERRWAAGVTRFIMPVVSSTPTGTPIPYTIVAQGTVGGFYTGGASCSQPDCGPLASWKNGSVPATTTLTFSPNPAPINTVIPIALWSTALQTTPDLYTTSASWTDGSYSGLWSFQWDLVLPLIYSIKINPSAPNPTSTPTMLYGLGPYSTQSTIQGNIYTELKGSYFAATPQPNTVASLDPTPMPTATQQGRIDFVFDGQTPQPFGLSFKKSTLMPGRTRSGLAFLNS